MKLMPIDRYGVVHSSVCNGTTVHSARHIRHRYAVTRQDRLARNKVTKLVSNNINISYCMTGVRAVRYIRNGYIRNMNVTRIKSKHRVLLAKAMTRGMSSRMLQYVAMLYVHRHIAIGPHNVTTVWSLVRRGIAVINAGVVTPA